MQLRRALVTVGIPLMAAIVAISTACSSTTTSSTGTTTTVAPASPSSSLGAPMTEPRQDIVATATAAGQFKTLTAALQAAGLAETLQGPGPYTVFAPTDDAFDKLPAGTVDTLLKPENKDELKTILSYHVVKGNVPASDVVKLDGKTVDTVAGQPLTIKVDGSKVNLVDATGNTVAVVKTDVQASNGVIHVIDGVLMPKS
jgi:uncharacterized surface protein with fasciclin (FAS1) repeats